MVNVNNYILCLTADDMKGNKIIASLFKRISLDRKAYDTKGLIFWINVFNQRKLDLEFEYAHMLKYFNKINCYALFSNSYQYSPNGANELANHYWYNYHLTSVVTRCLSLMDSLYQLINEKYELGIVNEPGFQNKVMNKLKGKNNDLSKFLSGFKNEQAVKQIIKLRNLIVHIYTPIHNENAHVNTNLELSPDKTKLQIDNFLNLLSNNCEEINTLLKK